MKEYVSNSFYYGGNSTRKDGAIPQASPYLFDCESRNERQSLKYSMWIIRMEKRKLTSMVL